MLAEAVPELRRELERRGDPARAAAMAAYMQDHFAFLGVAAPDRRAAARGFVSAGRHASGVELLDAADLLWEQPEREFQYVGADLLRRWVGALDATALPRVERLIRTRSWWDTVDVLAARVVGPLVSTYPELVAVMDHWIDDADTWIARSAILHQLGFRDGTDADRLFGYVDRRAGDTEFFIRKASGWALRELAKHDPAAVAAFVDARRDRLSGLTIREATKHLPTA